MRWVKHLMTLAALLAAFVCLAVFLLVPRKKTYEFKQLTCPDCRQGNFEVEYLENVLHHKMSSAWGYQQKEIECSDGPHMQACLGSCLTIYYKRLSEEDSKYHFDSMLQTCSEFVKVEREWPQYLARPTTIINSTLKFHFLVLNMNISYIYHRHQYHDSEVFDHLLELGYPEEPALPLPREQFMIRCIWIAVFVAVVILFSLTSCRKKLVNFCNCRETREEWTRRRRERHEAKDLEMTELGTQQATNDNEPTEDYMEQSLLEKVYNWLTSKRVRDAGRMRRNEEKLQKLEEKLKKTVEKAEVENIKIVNPNGNRITDEPNRNPQNLETGNVTAQNKTVTRNATVSDNSPPPPYRQETKVCPENMF